jgi:hypothetical protein
MKNVMTFESFVFEASEGGKIAKMLMKLDSMAWKKLAIKSGSELYANPEKQAEYKNILWTGLQGNKEMIMTNATEVYDALEDQNYHALNNALALMGFFGNDKYGKDLKNFYTKVHKETPNRYLTPNIVS